MTCDRIRFRVSSREPSVADWGSECTQNSVERPAGFLRFGSFWVAVLVVVPVAVAFCVGVATVVVVVVAGVVDIVGVGSGTDIGTDTGHGL